MNDPLKQTPGALLRARRQELGLTLDEVADRTRIRRTYLEALEEDRTEALPGETYRAGFLRIYANLLGLKLEQVLESERSVRPPAQKQEIREVKQLRASAGAHRVSRRSSKRNSGKGIYAIAAALLLVFGAVLSASLLRGPDPAPPAPVTTVPQAPPPAPAPAPSPEALAPAPEGEVLAPAAPSVDGVPPTAETSPAPAPATIPAEAAPAPKPLAPEGAKPTPATPGAAIAPPPQQTSVASEKPAEPPAPSKTNVLRLEALGTNHIELILDNRPPQTYDLKADTQLSWKVRRSALIRVKDPATVKLWFGDRPLDLNGRTQILVQTGSESGQGNP